MAYDLLGSVLSEIGRFDEAQGMFRTDGDTRADARGKLLRSGPMSASQKE